MLVAAGAVRDHPRPISAREMKLSSLLLRTAPTWVSAQERQSPTGMALAAGQRWALIPRNQAERGDNQV